ncbi:5-dehydro-2-deoxygluconokinase [Brachyspira alvinipulli]|uniref:5-dehydro-2-deoxygluconokinase n=1 Tax=Brachyspira alvinipulli TaxID=84379 RepID=UPI00261DDE3C|nr:5-dehydro-2-deoxygluconokinase [uncultured Brachyspira sp.]
MEYIEFDNKREYDLILLGRVTIDFNPQDYYKSLAESSTFIKYLGGSPANIAIGLSRLGKKCGFFSRVSDDAFGDFCIETFKKENVDVSHIKKAENGEKLGLTFTEILSKEESSILMYRNSAADLTLHVDDISEDYIRKSKAILISGTSLAQSPSREAALKAVMLANKTKTPIIFDIDYREYNWANKDEISIYYSIVANESSIILGSKEEYELTASLFGNSFTDKEIADYYFSRKAKIVLIKHGKEGSTAYIKNVGNYTIKPFPIQKLKSFGGGDGYASAFLYGIFEGIDIYEALELGSASASLLVASHGCSSFMPKLEDIQKYISDCKKEYGDMVARE